MNKLEDLVQPHCQDSKGVTVLCRSRELKDHWLTLLIAFIDTEKFSTFRI
jgi:hypothetical protein